MRNRIRIIEASSNPSRKNKKVIKINKDKETQTGLFKGNEPIRKI